MNIFSRNVKISEWGQDVFIASLTASAFLVSLPAAESNIKMEPPVPRRTTIKERPLQICGRTRDVRDCMRVESIFGTDFRQQFNKLCIVQGRSVGCVDTQSAHGESESRIKSSFVEDFGICGEKPSGILDCYQVNKFKEFDTACVVDGYKEQCILIDRLPATSKP